MSNTWRLIIYCVSIKGTMGEAGTPMSSSTTTDASLFPEMNLTFCCRLDGMAPAE